MTIPRPGKHGSRSNEAGPSKGLVALFTTARVVMNTLHRMVYPFLAVFARGLGVDLSNLSYVLTARSFAGTLGPFVAVLADRRGRKFGMLLGLGLFTCGAALVAARPAFLTFAAALILATSGKYIFDPCMQAWLGDRVPYAERGRVMAVTEFSWSLAFILGVPIVGVLIERRGWDAPFIAFAALGLLFTVLIQLRLPSGQGLAPIAEPQASSFRLVLQTIPALAGLAMGLFATTANELVNLIFGVWLEDSFRLQITALGAASAVIGFSELAGEGLVATLVDRLGKRRAVLVGLAANSLAALALPRIGKSETGAFLGLFLFYMTFEFTLVSSLPLISELVPRARATMMAFNVAALALGRALGDLLAPLLYRAGFATVTLAAVGFNLLALLALVRVQVTPKDQDPNIPAQTVRSKRLHPMGWNADDKPTH
jgi:predicted MFS family arabinose efflux permease